MPMQGSALFQFIVDIDLRDVPLRKSQGGHGDLAIDGYGPSFLPGITDHGIPYIQVVSDHFLGIDQFNKHQKQDTGY
jgi:hypothetical protein